MKLFLSLIALFGVIAIADIAVSPSAHAATINTNVMTLKGDKANITQEVRYRCWWRHGRRVCRWVKPWRHHRHCWWRHGRRVCR